MLFDLTRSVTSARPFSLRVSWKIVRARMSAFLYISRISLVQSLYRIIDKPGVNMKIEIEFKTESSNASQLSQRLSPILNAVQQQGLNAREFSIEMDIGSNGGSATQFPQKISSVLDSMNQQGLKAKEVELEISTGSSDIAPSMQKVSAVINSIKQQGFEVKELEVDAEKEE
jgi:hypothetical protein